MKKNSQNTTGNNNTLTREKPEDRITTTIDIVANAIIRILQQQTQPEEQDGETDAPTNHPKNLMKCQQD